jgi:hypothetical protein
MINRAFPEPNCPTNHVKGRPVDSLTLKALLAESLEVLRPVKYRFCAVSDCPVVYYAEDGKQTFTQNQLRELVYQKRPDDDEVLVCYCFQHTIGTIRAEWQSTGRSTIVERITAAIQAGQCACDIRNPQGSCCLGNVHQLLKKMGASP